MRADVERDALILSNLHLVKITARRIVASSFYDRRRHFDDLVGEGIIALVSAATNYDPSRGATFMTHAINCIRHAMYDYLRRTGDFTGKSYHHFIETGETFPARMPKNGVPGHEMFNRIQKRKYRETHPAELHFDVAALRSGLWI